MTSLPKTPYPRQLTKKETLDSLSHWKSSVRNYFRRASQYAYFFKSSSSWNRQNVNSGFSGEDAEEKADNLECLLDTIASFLPGPYITHQITECSTSIQSVWDIIWDHYGVKPTQHSFLDFNNLSKESDERYIDLYDKMIYHSMNHLCSKGTIVADSSYKSVELQSNDTLTTSHKNLIALNWLNKIHCKLVDVVKIEYSKDLKSGTPLSALVRNISDNIDSLLMRVNAANTRMIEDSVSKTDHQVMRLSNPRYPAPSSSFRGGRGQSNSSYQKSYNSRSHQQNQHCTSCASLGKRLSLYVNANHNPSQCPQASSIRAVQNGDESDANIVMENTEEAKSINYETPGINLNLISYPTLLSKIRNIETRMSAQSVLKARSPSTKIKINNCESYCIIDEGSELCCIDQEFAKSNDILFSRTSESAVAAGSNAMKLMGQTNDPVLVTIPDTKYNITWNLGTCIIVHNLGCPVLIGEPGKSRNSILTDPVKKVIKTLDSNKCLVSIPYASNDFNKFYQKNFICRIQENVGVYPGDEILLSVASHFHESQHLYFTPRNSPLSQPLPPQPCVVKNGKVMIRNTSPHNLILKKHGHFGDLVPSSIPNSKLESYKPHVYSITNKIELSKVQIDPDNLLNTKDKSRFLSLIQEYSDTISSLPGLYNGYYGNVDSSLNFIKDPPSSLKARLPSYSHEKLITMANLMDDMESMGVLAKPEDVGITPRNVHTSYLVPKTDGSFRFVTDFTSLLPFIGKLEVVAPSISEAKRMISSFKYHVELDLTHCFWQGQMSAKDSQYLATPHPFQGLRVYVREPQGIRNASEHNSERLARVFGDLEQQGRMCRMADGLYIGGKSIEELLGNLREVFCRARHCGLTFKPSKVVVCPKKTVLFGWEKNGSQWSPTTHVITPLSQAPRPKTVKQLRGFIGAYRQLSSTIPNYSTLIGLLEKYGGGKASRDHILWSEEMISEFEKAKSSLNDLESIAIPNPEDTLHIYPDFSETANAIGSHLVIHRPDVTPSSINGGYFSVRLEDCQTRWTPCEKECLGIKLSIHHFRPFIQNSKNRTIIHTDNLICVQAWNRLKQGHISTSSKVASFLSSLSENNIEIVHFPGSQTRVADYSSRHPIRCDLPRCQICNYASEQTKVGDIASIMSITVGDINHGNYKIPLNEKPSWLKLQKQDETHRLLYRLITSGGLQPEPKLRGHTDLKRMYNLYKKRLLSIDPSGLITVKYIDGQSGMEYDAISVPKHLYPGLVQSIHIKLDHPSRAQMHKFLHRYFFCIGLTHTVDTIHTSCQICTSLAIMPKFDSDHTSTEKLGFGSHFSADIVIINIQKIFVCRENLSQFTITKIIEDETSDSIRDAIVASTLEFVPPNGTTIRVDPAPAHKLLADLENDDTLRRYNIRLDLGRVHNPNKNPVGENAVKEFRKEHLRIDKTGGVISESNRAIITFNMNQRIRFRGLSAKEILLRRELMTNDTIPITDTDLANLQLQFRQRTNDSHNEKLKKPHVVDFKIGDRVFIREDLDKLRGREEYIIIKDYSKMGKSWSTIQKTEKSLRNIDYDIQSERLIPVSTCFIETEETELNQSEDEEPLHGFATQEIPKKSGLKDIIDNLNDSIPSRKGRPPKAKYPDYIQDDLEYDNQLRFVEYKKNVPPSHGWDQNQWNQILAMDDLEDDIVPNIVKADLPAHHENIQSIPESDLQLMDISSENSLPPEIPVKDPYESLKQWEIDQRQNARRTLSYQLCSSPDHETNQPTEASSSDIVLKSTSTQGEWDHQFDTNSPTYLENDEPLNDNVFADQMEIDFALSPMSQVQSVDKLYVQHNLNVDTNICQNVEHILPQPQKRKRVSPPRKMLPLERQDQQYGVLTRRQRRLTLFDSITITPSPNEEKKRRKTHN